MADRIAVMNKGILQQLDTPQNLYDYPSNWFVAGFIGSPAMNFFPGKIRKDGGGLLVDTDDFAVKIPDNKAAPYQTHTGKEIIMGIRPEDIHNPIFVPPGIHAEKVDGRVDVIEMMGYEIMLHMVSGKQSFIARVDPRTRFAMGDRVELSFNMDNFHIFDPAIDRENPIAIR